MAKNNVQTSKLLGGILREMREEKKLDRGWVAEHTDIGLRHLTAIELGEKRPSVETLCRLIRCYGASADRIFYPESYVADDRLEEANRLIAASTPGQRQLIVAFIRMLQDQTDLDL